jgi:hypothetical protein
MTATMVLTVRRWPSTTVLMIGEGFNIVDLGKRIFSIQLKLNALLSI